MALIDALQMAGRIGLITPYKDQKRALRREIGDRFGGEALQAMEISTVVGGDCEGGKLTVRRMATRDKSGR